MKDQFELHSLPTKTGAVSAVSADQRADNASVLERQTRTRRLFSFSQLFAFSLTYMGLWQTILTNSFYALNNGGPNALFFGFLVVFTGALAQASSIGEMASMQPIAGAQYHWTWHLAPPRLKRFTTWIQGWTTWFGYVSLLAGSANFTVNLLESLISLNHDTYSAGGWHTTLLVIATVVVQASLNIYCFRVVPWIEFLGGILHFVLFIIFIVVLTVMGPRNSSSFFLSSNVSSGWDNYFISWNVGMLSSIWAFTGFDSVIHMSEETRTAKEAVPRAMFWSILTNGVMGLVMVVIAMVAMGPVDNVLDAKSALIGILMSATRSKTMTTVLIGGIFTTSFCSTLATIASVSRLTWAWARDGGLPGYLGYVNSKHRVPVRAVVVTVTIIGLLCLLNLGSSAYIVFGAIAALSSLALYLSYAIAIACMLYSRLTTQVVYGEWRLGRAGVAINLFALAYTLWAMVFLPFPTTMPVDAGTMNYCGPVLGFVLVIALILWFVRGQKQWTGPNLTIIEFVLRNS
ncbi:amino acid/polyamine transporter I [Xylariaceae sp. FL0016]|nr:amino acid/polyamine transporter I [Xylariaceae sp. FL0016]